MTGINEVSQLVGSLIGVEVFDNFCYSSCSLASTNSWSNNSKPID
jgi:hypothetical protein